VSRIFVPFIGVLILAAVVLFGSAVPSRAVSSRQPQLAASPSDLINAVNALRASFGLAPYSVNAILMSTAQAQADFMAATENMTHSGPGGIGLTDRLLAAGYPLAGDLSLGGFRAENITGGDENMPAETAVDRWTGDTPHLNTMVSQYLTEIGAGVAVNNGRVYFVIDAARPTTSGELQVPGVQNGENNAVVVPEVPLVIIPVTVNTPNAEGNVIHEVKPGQTLWQLAISYETKIDEIKRLNGLVDNNIYPGNHLLVRTAIIVPTSTLAEVPTQEITSTVLPPVTATAPSVTSTPEHTSSFSRPNKNAVMNVMIGIIALAIVGGGVFTWLGMVRKK
jgi:uncharacterized protein YkwD/LysM repeat protein